MHRFGKYPRKSDYRTLRFQDYAAALPPPPAAYSVIPIVQQKTGIADIGKLFPMDGNDTMGDCTIAGMAHAITVWGGLIGKTKIMLASSVERVYRRLTGGQDTGLNELDVLNYCRKNQIALGEEILGFVSINPRNHAHVMQSTHLLGGCYIGFQCQENCIEDFDAGKVWTPGKLTQDGHCVFVVGYDQDTVTVLTWGGIQKGTWAWFDETCDEAYALLPPEAKTPGFCPGFNFSQLKTDLALVAH